MSDDERGKLAALAKSVGLTPSDWIRMTVQVSFEALSPAQKKLRKEWPNK